MVHRAQVAHCARSAARWGVNASSLSVDLAKIVAQKDEIVLSFRGGLQKQVDKRANLRLLRGHACFFGPLMLVNQPYTLFKGAVYIHPTLAEGFFFLMEDVKPAD
jgi:pyruvate/2-oxoglutarate dehydrogenase complex dihydrolipoamide dehydrogenase (E3) component